MRVEREHIVSFIVALIAILVIAGGYASFSGLATYDEVLKIDMSKQSFKQSDVFDVDVIVNPVTFLADESIMVYIDNNAIGVVALRKYLDDNRIDYGLEVKNLGQNNMEIITLKDHLTINLAAFIETEYTHPGTTHILRVEFSKGDASAEEMFRAE